MVLFIMLYKVVLTFEPVDEILKFNNPYKLISLYFKESTDKSMLQTKCQSFSVSVKVSATEQEFQAVLL